MKLYNLYASSLYNINCNTIMDVRGRVVRVIDLESLAPHHSGFKSRQELWILSCEEAIQLAYRMSVVLLSCLHMPEIMHGGALEVFVHQ